MTPKAMTVASLAQHWGVSTTFVYDQIHAGRLGAFRLGGKLWRIPVAAVEAYEEAATVQLAAPDPSPGSTSDQHAKLSPAQLGRLVRAGVR